MPKYGALPELITAIEAGEINRDDVTVWLDNDQVTAVTGSDALLLDLHPADLLRQALAALGLYCEEV